jgi:hypothetical protein
VSGIAPYWIVGGWERIGSQSFPCPSLRLIIAQHLGQRAGIVAACVVVHHEDSRVCGKWQSFRGGWRPLSDKIDSLTDHCLKQDDLLMTNYGTPYRQMVRIVVIAHDQRGDFRWAVSFIS